MSDAILAFGAHPDDVEFGCGGIVALETQRGRAVHLVICSRGESGTVGSADQRQQEAERGAAILGATVEFIELGGDAHMAVTVPNTIHLASRIRLHRPAVVLAPTPVENQHPDHARVGQMVRDAVRLARYGGVHELRDQPPHMIRQLLFYAITAEAEPRDVTPVLIDVSTVMTPWKDAMEAHGSQTSMLEYVELQLTRARLRGLTAGIGYAIPLFPNDPLVLDSLGSVTRSARRF